MQDVKSARELGTVEGMAVGYLFHHHHLVEGSFNQVVNEFLNNPKERMHEG